MTHTANAVQQKALAWGLVPAVMFAAVVVTPVQSHAQDALRIAPSGNIGLGIDSPERQLHLRGSNTVVRLDRSTDAATFMMVRTAQNDLNNVWKTFSVGTRASGPGVGEFVIQDFGQNTEGASQRRMTITNTGEAHFTGTVRAPAFDNLSSARLKQDIETLDGAGRSLEQLRGVRFTWKDTGRPALGLIAEEVATVYPELVARDDQGAATAVNYSALLAVLVEAFKEQQGRMAAQEAELAAYQSQVAAQQVELARLENRLAEFETLQARFNRIEDLLMRTEPSVVVLSR